MQTNLLTALLAITVASCSTDDYNQFENGKNKFSDDFENKLPANLIGSYGTNRIDAEPGTLIVTKDSLITNTVNHQQAFKISEHFNYYDPNCGWYIRVNDITYMLTTGSDDMTWFKFMRKSETKMKGIGVYYKDYKEPINEM